MSDDSIDSTTIDLKSLVRDIDDFPQPGIGFKDITPLMRDAAGLRTAIDQLTEAVQEFEIDIVVAAEARGFLFGPALAYRLGAGFAPVRKPGKLPFDTHTIEYDLEYGTDSLQIHIDGVLPDERVLLVDDVIATGGTMAAKAQLIENLGAKVVGCAVIIELTFLKGRDRLAAYPFVSLVQY